MKNIFFIFVFVLCIFLVNHSSFATEVCPISGKMVILCRKNPSVGVISLAGCYNGGIAYLCTSQIPSCEAVNEQAIQNVQWTMPEYVSQKFKFMCPGDSKETLAQRVTIDAKVWKNVAEKALSKDQPRICPRDKMPILCTQQSKGVSLIGCHSAGLSYICSQDIQSCDQVNDKMLTSMKWVQARYNDKKMIFECPGVETSNIRKHVIVQSENWDKAVSAAQ